MNRRPTFNAIDVETANADRASICQIGVVHIVDGEIQDQWKTLIDPEDWFDPWNIEIHGIDEDTVKGSPTLPEVRDELRLRLRDSILVSHTAFDRTAFERAMAKYRLKQLQVTWLDSAKIVRRAWPEKYARRGWGLKSVAQDLGIEFRHHDALEDATAAARIVRHVCEDSGLDIDGWLQRVRRPISSSSFSSIEKDGNVEGHLNGEKVVFTGSLAVPRRQAADWAANAGCDVDGVVTRKTTILVVGVQDKGKLNGYQKSSKHRKAEKLISDGQDLQILSEDDFLEILKLDEEELHPIN